MRIRFARALCDGDSGMAADGLAILSIDDPAVYFLRCVPRGASFDARDPWSGQGSLERSGAADQGNDARNSHPGTHSITLSPNPLGRRGLKHPRPVPFRGDVEREVAGKDVHSSSPGKKSSGRASNE